MTPLLKLTPAVARRIYEQCEHKHGWQMELPATRLDRAWDNMLKAYEKWIDGAIESMKNQRWTWLE